MSATMTSDAVTPVAEASLLVMAPGLVVESLDDTQATLYLQGDGTRLRVPRALHALLLRFTTPAALEAIVADVGDGAGRALARLRDKGFLVVPGSAPRLRPLTDPPVRLFDGPAQKLVASEADIVVLGFPWDFGDVGAAGARHGPLALREISLQLLYGVDRTSGRALGWFDTDRCRPVLQGVSLADAGDVLIRHGEATASAFQRAVDAWRTLTRLGPVGVLLGGDSSVALTAITASAEREPIEVIRFAREASRAHEYGSAAMAATLASHALALPGVRGFHDIVGAHDTRSSVDAVAALPGYRCTALVQGETDGVHALASADAAVHLGIDMSAVRSAATAGMDYRAIARTIARIGREHRIVSIDLCGLNPWQPCWGAVSMTALHLLVAAMSAAKDDA